ncbi:hypothetical protein [Scopulibacillus darangshiensis]|nr:hypothetical protein [Scopulibacillus darangshiensis]
MIIYKNSSVDQRRLTMGEDPKQAREHPRFPYLPLAAYILLWGWTI